jgi:hypothetical protein
LSPMTIAEDFVRKAPHPCRRAKGGRAPQRLCPCCRTRRGTNIWLQVEVSTLLMLRALPIITTACP